MTRSSDATGKPLDGGLARERRVGQNFEVIVTVRDAVERVGAGWMTRE